MVQNAEDLLTEMVKLRDAFEALDLPIKVDLSEWTSASRLAEAIHTVGIHGVPGIS